MSSALSARTTAPAADIDRALARADAYRVLAATFGDPDAPGAHERLDLSGLRGSLGRLDVPVDDSAWRTLRGNAHRLARAAEHRAIFGHVVAHGCPPYETEYGRTHVFGQSQVLADIRGFYEAFGVRPRRGGERPDHVACELEFLALLSLKEAIALAQNDEERQAVCRAAAAHFIEDHVGRWLPALAGSIASRASGSGFAAAAALAAALVAHHAADLGIAPRAFGPDDLLPTVDEPEGFSFDCGIDAASGDMAPPGA
ncbi:MAG: molecular chaperone TorD family protein [Chloroflexota bacterium]